MIAGYYTKAETDNKVETVTAGKIESFKSSIESSVEAIKILPLQATVANILRPNNPDFNNISLVQDGTTNAPYVLKVAGLEGGVNIFAAENVPFNPNRLYRVKYRLKRVAGTGIVYPAVVPMNMYKTGGITANNSGLNINTISSVIYPLAGSTAAMPLDTWVEGTYYIKGQSAGASTGAGTLTNPRTMPNLGVYLRLGFICPIRTDFLIEYFILEEADDEVTANALNTTNTEVARINGVVSGHTTQLSNLTASVAGKADTSALNALTVRVAAEEGKSSSQATSITNLTASLSATDTIAKNALPQIGGSGSFKTFKEVLSVYLANGNTSNSIVIETPITFTAKMFRISGKGYNYRSTRSVIDFDVSAYAYSGTSILEHGAKNNGTFGLRIRLGVKNSKICIILTPLATSNFSYPQFTLDASIGYTAAPDSWKDGWTYSLVAEASLASSGITAIMEPSLLDFGAELIANASAVTSLTTEVSRVNGVATSAANSTTLLTSRMGEAENKLLVQGKVTDGVRSSYVVKMETGNVVGGFGMVQETGALGNVITSFGVNADTFFIGSPSGKKKPFAVLGTSGLINGVTVPAGTYIDTAYIPNGTITNAKIGDLSADKITTGSIAADRMKANIVAAAQGQFTTLSALSAKIGVLRTATSGARTEIKDNLIEVYDSSGKLRVRLGVWS